MTDQPHPITTERDTIVNADLILVIDTGEDVEAGTHHELMARGEHDSHLVAAQRTTDRVRPGIA